LQSRRSARDGSCAAALAEKVRHGGLKVPSRESHIRPLLEQLENHDDRIVVWRGSWRRRTSAETSSAGAVRMAKAIKNQTHELLLRGVTVDLDSPAATEFILDATRAAEGLATDDDLCGLTNRALTKLTKNKALALAIKNEAARRERGGITARERAARHFSRNPEILNAIASNANASPAHRISARKEIRETATAGRDAGNANVGMNFVIKIDLSAGGGGVENYEHVLAPKTPPVIEGKADESKLDR
jgi:hypothetical protein